MSDFNLYSVNWRDGMGLSQDHLVRQERYLEELSRWRAQGQNDRWGLVRKSGDGHAALQLDITAGSGAVTVEVVRCHAITPDGSVIHVDDKYPRRPRARVDGSPQELPVYIAVNEPGKIETGDPDPQEDPPRSPFRVANYAIFLERPPQLPQGRFLQVAQLAVDGSDVTHSSNWYPPCLTTYADERLDQKMHDYRNRLENLLSLSSRAFAAIHADASLVSTKTNLQDAFKQTIYMLAYHLSATLDDFVIGRNAIHPLQLVLYFKKLFRVLGTSLNFHPTLKDYLNERFFSREMNTEIGRFMGEVDSFVLSEYDHRALGRHLHDIDGLLGALRNLMGFFAQVKKDQLGVQAVATDSVTYHGQTYRVADYGDVKVNTVGELSYLIIDLDSPQPVSDIVAMINKELFTSAQWTSMQVRLGLNEARGLGETDPVEIDTVTYDAKVALHPQDMLKSPAVKQIALIFRGAAEADRFAGLSKMDLTVYTI